MRERRVRLPAYLRPMNLVLVCSGGVIGVLAREALVASVPDVGDIPTAILLANVLGALLLGVLLESLVVVGEESRTQVSLRLLLGTGLLGGFTTYSALAQTFALLWMDGVAWLALLYGLGTVLLGGCATWAGVALGAALRRRRGASAGQVVVGDD